MANNNKHTGPNVPALRFPEFSGEWSKDCLNEFLEVQPARNTQGIYSKDDVLSVSGDYGVVNQIQLLGRSFAGKDVSNYHIVRTNDIVYTKSPLKEFPYGIVKTNQGTAGIVSTLYAVYSAKSNTDPKFVEYYFSSKERTNKYFKPIVRIGAKHDMKIGNEEVLRNIVVFPSKQEQNKIQEFLRIIDERIATQSKIIEELTTLRSALHQGIMSTGLEDGSWRMQTLAEVLYERTELNNEGHAVHSVSVSKGIVNQLEYLGRSFAAKDTSRYHVAYPGDVIYTKSPTGEFPYGIVKQSQISIKAALSPLYGVYVPISPEIGYIIHNHFLSAKNALNYLHPLIQKGAKNTINITNQRFLQNSMPLPTNKNAASLYYNAIKTVSDKIILEEMVMEKFQSQKSFLLKTMFI